MKDLQKVLTRQTQSINAIYVSSYIPRRCGIATYTKDLTNAINLLNTRSLSEILTITRTNEEIDYPWEAKFKITHDDLATYLNAAHYVNQSHADVVHLQHEFGLFGGENGEYILHFVEALEKPLISTFHTVINDPSRRENEILQRLAKKSKAIIVMMESVGDRLAQQYRIKREKIVVIPHGVPDFTFNATTTEKKKRQLSNRLVLGNINLLNPNKGIEYALEAVAEIAKRYPHILYVVIGQTHPVLLKQEGEKYRHFLQHRVRELGITNNVRFVNKYLPLKDVVSWLKTIDVYVTPYLEPHQITSGALAYAIGAGKACVSTPYIYAQEVLAEKRGLLVPFRNAQAITDAVIDLVEHPEKKKAIEHHAYHYGRLMTWPNVAQSHISLFHTILRSIIPAMADSEDRQSPGQLPDPRHRSKATARRPA